MEWNGMESNGMEWTRMEWNRSNGTESIKCVVVAGADADAAAVEGISVVFLYDVNI